MTKQVINIGTAANDASGDPLRTAFDKTNDNFTEVYDRIQALEASGMTAASITRTKLTVPCTASAGQVITFSSDFFPVYALNIIDYEGLGIEVTAQDENGFTITSLTAGNFGYIAMIEV